MYSQEAVLQYVQEQMGLDIDAIKEEMARKKNNEILQNHNYSISQGKDRRWRTYVTDETKKSGRRQVVKKTEEALMEELIKHYSFEESAKENITLGALYDEWIEHKRITSTSETNVSRINSTWEKHYKNASVINIPIKNLTRAKLKEWAYSIVKENEMDAKQYANFSLIIRQMLEYAIDLEIIDKNVFNDVKVERRLFRRTRKEAGDSQIYTKEEKELLRHEALRDFKSNSKREKFFLVPLAILFQFETGMRVGEVCALKHSDVSDDSTIHVQRMYQRDTKKLIDKTKSDLGERNVILTKRAKEIISMAKTYQKENGYKDNYLIFSINEEPLKPYAFNDALKTYCKRLGITYKSSHKARKTYATNLIDAGVNIATVREQMGHASEITTFKHYYNNSKNIEEQREMITNALEN